MPNESKSPGWIRKGALWTYDKPPTPEEKRLKNSRKHKELMAEWRTRLGEAAFHCPECGSDNYMEWCMGWWPTDEHYHDSNRKECQDCGHWWWVVFPTCGHNEGRTKESYFADSEKRKIRRN